MKLWKLIFEHDLFLYHPLSYSLGLSLFRLYHATLHHKRKSGERKNRGAEEVGQNYFYLFFFSEDFLIYIRGVEKNR